ncbi:PH domain-containing protein [Bowmanella sp. JS7-9]|uniref:PH domain-containing protein n=1 Tax=Pseudobowmanella zhangzhouensis TaxID=1537679 RepID=A0ABW1XI01_9ALTE|nr:PH domain-containing protein [Bowmanella sp. JS7-9]TBX20790.1 helicase [Bowmanella sp. JS7-9]
MGILDGLLGNASEIDVAKIQDEFAPILGETETIIQAYKVIRDMFVFTSARLILVDKQGLTGKKVEYHSIPYKAITHFKVETAGHFDLDAELKIYISGEEQVVSKELKKDSALSIQKALASGMFG